MIREHQVYFLHDRRRGEIKIGRTVKSHRTARDRIRELQGVRGGVLSCLGVIDGRRHLTESYVHGKFSHLRVRGEWFRDDPEIRDFILNQATSEG